jgi:hypothetical protein
MLAGVIDNGSAIPGQGSAISNADSRQTRRSALIQSLKRIRFSDFARQTPTDELTKNLSA